MHELESLSLTLASEEMSFIPQELKGFLVSQHQTSDLISADMC